MTQAARRVTQSRRLPKGLARGLGLLLGLLRLLGLLGEIEFFGLRARGGVPPGGGTPTLNAGADSTCPTLSGGGRSERRPSSRLRFIASCWPASGSCRMLRSSSESGAGRLINDSERLLRRATACKRLCLWVVGGTHSIAETCSVRVM